MRSLIRFVKGTYTAKARHSDIADRGQWPSSGATAHADRRAWTGARPPHGYTLIARGRQAIYNAAKSIGYLGLPEQRLGACTEVRNQRPREIGSVDL
jgi:hypothetical protein